MELHQIRYFIALARSLNFTRAAQQCNVTQPALTKAMQRLEAELGGVLVHRERQLTQLTDLGKLVLPMFERTYNAAEAARISAQEFQRRDVAPLRIALGSSISAAVLERPIAEVARFLPGLRVELVEAEPSALSDMLLGGEVNAAFCGDDVGEAPLRIDHWNLAEERMLVLMPRGCPLVEYEELPLDVLKDAIWLERLGGQTDTLWHELFPNGETPRIAHRGRSLAHLQHLACAGLGLSFWPEHAPHGASLTTRPVVGNRLLRNLRLLVVAGRRYSPALESLVKVARVHDWTAHFPKLELDQARSGGPCAGGHFVGEETA